MHSPRIVLALVIVLSGCARDKSLATVASLERNRDERSVSQLSIHLHDNRPAVRYAAARALGRMGLTAAVEPLLGALEDKNQYVREAVIRSLASLNDDRAILPIARHLSSDTAAVALRRFGYARVKNKLDEGRNQLWVDKLRLMESFGPFPPRIRLLFDAEPHVGFRVDYSGDAELKERVFEELEQYLGPGLLAHRTGTPERLMVVLALDARALGQSYQERGLLYSGASLAAEVKVLAEGQPVYSFSTSHKSYPPYMIYADSSYTVSRTSAPIGFEISYVLGPILRGLQAELTDITNIKASNVSSEDPKVRLAAVRHLGEIGATPEATILLSRLNDPDRSVRLAVIRSLGLIGDSTAVKPLLPLVTKCDDTDVCAEAARALGRIGDQSTVEPLLRLLDSRKTLVSAPHGRYETDVVALTIADGLGLIGDLGSVAGLTHIVLDDNGPPGDLRSAAARSLGRIGGHEAFETLLKCARFINRREYISVCVEGLGEIGELDMERAVRTIKEAAFASSVSQDMALTRLGKKEIAVHHYTDFDRVDGWSEAADKDSIEALFSLLGKQGPSKSRTRCAIVRALVETSNPSIHTFFVGNLGLLGECIGGHSRVAALTKVLGYQEPLSPQIELDPPLATLLRLSLNAFHE